MYILNIRCYRIGCIGMSLSTSQNANFREVFLLGTCEPRGKCGEVSDEAVCYLSVFFFMPPYVLRIAMCQRHQCPHQINMKLHIVRCCVPPPPTGMIFKSKTVFVDHNILEYMTRALVGILTDYLDWKTRIVLL